MLNGQPTDLFLSMLNAALVGQPPITVTGTTTTASTAVTALGDVTGVAIGAVVNGLDIVTSPPTKVVDVDNVAHTITLSQNATTGHAATPLTFSNPVQFTALKIGLYTAKAGALTNLTVLTDLTEPTYTGYARQAVTIEMLRRNSAGDFLDPISGVSFQPTDAVGLPQTAIGTMLIGTVGGVDMLLMAQDLDTPFPFISQFSGFDETWEILVRNQTTYGGVCSTC